VGRREFQREGRGWSLAPRRSESPKERNNASVEHGSRNNEPAFTNAGPLRHLVTLVGRNHQTHNPFHPSSTPSTS